MSEIVNNNPKKELMFAVGGIVLFLAIVLLIGISAFLRPAGEHITAETTEESAAVDNAEVIVADDTPVVTESIDAGVDAEETEATDMNIGAGEPSAEDTPAAATVTPSTGDAVIATQAGEATANGVVNQAAVAETDLVGPSDQVAGTVNPPVAAE